MDIDNITDDDMPLWQAIACIPLIVALLVYGGMVWLSEAAAKFKGLRQGAFEGCSELTNSLLIGPHETIT